ncbi:hypothetical protein AB0D14_23430 [Streptomyces sp. NPDC048484]|uniref:hypothetical protein n=1 Tax=Streptomyces sp. NPDC048484 TaxID=3155146 RepID=UPI00342FBB87
MIDLVLYGPSGPQPLGRPVAVRVELRNTGERDLWIAGVLDGSENGLRFPRYLPTVRRVEGAEGAEDVERVEGAEDGLVVASPAPAEDPLVGPLRPADLRRLAPGESWDPTSGPGCLPLMTFAHFAPRRSGRYRYTLTFDTEAARPEDWLGGFGVATGTGREDLLALVARVPRTTVVAAPVEVDFR